MKSDLLATMAQLQEMDKLTQRGDAIINDPIFHQMPQLQAQLDHVETLLAPLIQAAEIQSSRLDAFINQYEQMMKLMSECALKWKADIAAAGGSGGAK